MGCFVYHSSFCNFLISLKFSKNFFKFCFQDVFDKYWNESTGSWSHLPNSHFWGSTVHLAIYRCMYIHTHTCRNGKSHLSDSNTNSEESFSFSFLDISKSWAIYSPWSATALLLSELPSCQTPAPGGSVAANQVFGPSCLSTYPAVAVCSLWRFKKGKNTSLPLTLFTNVGEDHRSRTFATCRDGMTSGKLSQSSPCRKRTVSYLPASPRWSQWQHAGR